MHPYQERLACHVRAYVFGYVAEAWEVSDYRETTGTAEEVAEAVLFLASARMTYVLGEFIEVNGRQLMD